MIIDLFFFSSRRRHTRFDCDWSSDVCSSDLVPAPRADGPEPWRALGRARDRRPRAPALRLTNSAHGRAVDCYSSGRRPGPAPRETGRVDPSRQGARMIKPYTAVGLIPTVRGIRKRKDIKINLDRLSHLVKAASWLSSLDLPVRLIAFPEGALQAFNDEGLDLDHATFARECAIDIPGEETEALGKIAKEYDAFVMAQAKATHPALKARFFNAGLH